MDDGDGSTAEKHESVRTWLLMPQNFSVNVVPWSSVERQGGEWGAKEMRADSGLTGMNERVSGQWCGSPAGGQGRALVWPVMACSNEFRILEIKVKRKAENASGQASM